MVQELIVFLIVGVAAVFTLLNLYRKFRGTGCRDSYCRGCGSASSCREIQSEDVKTFYQGKNMI